jgi:pyridoxal 5-phosphate dependent beta-lyase
MTDRDEHERWRWWRERRPQAERVHLDTGAAGRSSVATLRATAGHAQREAAVGGYVAQAEATPVLDEGRTALAGLFGMAAAGVAFVENAHAALHALLDVWPLADGDAVAVVPSEWGPNLHAFAHRGLRITELGVDSDGLLDLAGLERVLASDPPALVHLTQVVSHRPLVQPVREAAVLCREAGVPLWVDAAQAVGHVDTTTGADVVYATSRKWLTGPRGVGMLGVAEPWWERLRIDAPVLERDVQPAGTGPVWFLESNEAHVAGRVGLCNAVREFMAAGPDQVWQRLALVGRQAREVLADLPGWAVVPAAGPDSAITALRALDGQDIAATRARLLDQHGIVTTAGATARAPLEMTEPLLRVSPHVDCTSDDLTLLRKALQTLT